jgi:hypothetical protein
VQWKIYGGYTAAAAAAAGCAWQVYAWASGSPPPPPGAVPSPTVPPPPSQQPAASGAAGSAGGVQHVVLLKLQPEATDAERAAIVAQARVLPGKIPEIKSYVVGEQISSVDDGRNVAVGLVAKFDSETDYQLYAKHPDHVAFIQSCILPVIAPGGRSAVQLRHQVKDAEGSDDDVPCGGVTHAVLLKLQPGTTAEQRAAIVAGLRGLPAKIPEIRTYSVGEQLGEVDDGRNATIGLVATFGSEGDYEVYAKHAEHVAVIKGLILPVIAPGGRTALQVESAEASLVTQLAAVCGRLGKVQTELQTVCDALQVVL